MEIENRVWYRFLSVLRLGGMSAVLAIALAGAHQASAADELCYPWLIRCTNDPDDCVEELHDECWQPGECEGTIFCRPSFQYVGCYEYEFMVMCEEDESPPQ